MGGESKLRKWMKANRHSYESLARLLGISPQSLHYGVQRGTFGRLTVHKLVHLTGLDHEEFLLPEERQELRRLRKQSRGARDVARAGRSLHL
jgi:hypothetical protein